MINIDGFPETLYVVDKEATYPGLGHGLSASGYLNSLLTEERPTDVGVYQLVSKEKYMKTTTTSVKVEKVEIYGDDPTL